MDEDREPILPKRERKVSTLKSESSTGDLNAKPLLKEGLIDQESDRKVTTEADEDFEEIQRPARILIDTLNDIPD